MVKIDILDLSLDELEKMFLELGLKKFNALQVYQWLHKNWYLTLMNFQIFPKKLENYLRKNLK